MLQLFFDGKVCLLLYIQLAIPKMKSEVTFQRFFSAGTEHSTLIHLSHLGLWFAIGTVRKMSCKVSWWLPNTRPSFEGFPAVMGIPPKSSIKKT